jgi:hypothetical protein
MHSIHPSLFQTPYPGFLSNTTSFSYASRPPEALSQAIHVHRPALPTAFIPRTRRASRTDSLGRDIAQRHQCETISIKPNHSITVYPWEKLQNHSSGVNITKTISLPPVLRTPPTPQQHPSSENNIHSQDVDSQRSSPEGVSQLNTPIHLTRIQRSHGKGIQCAMSMVKPVSCLSWFPLKDVEPIDKTT